MKQIQYLLLVILACCASCGNTTTTTTTTTFDSVSTVTTIVDGKHDLFLLDSVLKQYETPSQHLKSSYAHPMQVRGAKGTVISVNPDDLETMSGKPFSASIDIELKELTSTEDLIRSRAATVSDGKLLVSGGAYYINMTCAGEQVKLKSGKSLNVRFPKITDDKMSFFYGQRDSLGQMNWKPQQETANNGGGTVETDIYMRKDGAVMSDSEKRIYALNDKVFSEISLQYFGWINCDHFLRDGNLTDLLVSFDRSDSLHYVNTFLAFKEINSVMQRIFDASAGANTFDNIPLNAKVVLIAVAVKDNKLFTSKVSLTMTANPKIVVKMKETAEKDIPDLFKMN